MNQLSQKSGLKFLIIRRDNIGDLVCTTPVFTALRQRFPAARICALVNSYNAPVLAGHPAVDRLFVYTKLKHRAPGQSRLRLLWQRLRMHRELKKIGFDYILLPGDQPRLLRFAHGLHPKHIVMFGQTPVASKIVTIQPAQDAEHETQAVYRLLGPLDIHGTPPATSIVPDTIEVDKARAVLAAQLAAAPAIAIHISARKPSQRWPADSFVQLIRGLHERHGARFMLFWSPGAEDNPLHPGDDNKAAEIMRGLADIPILAFPTHTLQALIGGLSVCDFVICSDGGAMHLAAALGKPIVCFFGKSNAARWHPWSVPHVVLQTPSREVDDIAPQEALSAFEQLIMTPGIQLNSPSKPPLP